MKEGRADIHAGLTFSEERNQCQAINAQFGHVVGEKVIIAVANTLRTVNDERVMLARVGGEKLTLVTASLLAEKAEVLARTICT